ncbi:MAG: sugar phosphate nucleotidyltransferase [Candidatus Sumerlaeota bacterium]|nr:sugar phosphate nucleotidyltransferase [Candidatus Sumerlaeota bacterium]
MRAVILAGGMWTRLYPYTVAFPKPLMPLDDMPIIEIVVRQLAAQGIQRVTMAVGHLAELMIAFLGDGARFGLRIDYSREDQPLGTAGPLRNIPDLPETFLVMNGDLLTTLNYGDLIRRHRESGADVTIACHRREVKIDFGVIETDANGRVSGYIEKPSIPYTVSMGAYVFNRIALDYIPAGRYFDFPALIHAMMSERVIATHFHEGEWLDIGRHDDYEEAQRIFAERRSIFLPK